VSVAKYLARYAEPEAKLVARAPTRYRAVLVVPAHRERADLLDGFVEAAANAGGRVLVVLVVNAAKDSSPAALEETRELWHELSHLKHDAFELALIDRVSPGRELPPKQGVGLARKIGADLALALWAQRRVELPYIFSTDADASLPADYFRAAAESAPVSALLYPFRHEPGGDPSVDAATERYELGLRYHVLGLNYARSPYAYHSLGSTLALGCEAYAAVRGFPKRLAGEDFYVLDKLAKIGSVLPLGSAAVRIRARLSDRVPFGTGPRVRTLSAGGTFEIYHPDRYQALGAVLDAFAELATGRALPPIDDRALSALRSLGFERELADALEQCKTEAVLLRRLLTWFDGLKTLRFIHALRDSARPDIPLDLALRQAPFVPAGADCAALIAAEQALSGPRGVSASLAQRLGPKFG
jgi:hypothetical protein